MRAVATLVLFILLLSGCAQFAAPEHRPEVHLIDVIPLASPAVGVPLSSPIAGR